MPESEPTQPIPVPQDAPIPQDAPTPLIAAAPVPGAWWTRRRLLGAAAAALLFTAGGAAAGAALAGAKHPVPVRSGLNAFHLEGSNGGAERVERHGDGDGHH